MNAREILERDHERETALITEVEDSENGWFITRDDSWAIFVSAAECSIRPVTGAQIVLFGRGIGYPVRGIIIGDRVYRYQTTEQYEAQAAADRLERARAQARKAVEERPERDMRIAKLPAPLQERMRRFARINDNWCAEFEPYELFVCEEAAEIARLFPGDAERQAFYSAAYDKQKAMAPKLRLDEHSGNTFGAACNLANILIHHPELVARAHGALCPLVGCDGYGCYAAHEGRVEKVTP